MMCLENRFEPKRFSHPREDKHQYKTSQFGMQDITKRGTEVLFDKIRTLTAKFLTAAN